MRLMILLIFSKYDWRWINEDKTESTFSFSIIKGNAMYGFLRRDPIALVMTKTRKTAILSLYMCWVYCNDLVHDSTIERILYQKILSYWLLLFILLLWFRRKCFVGFRVRLELKLGTSLKYLININYFFLKVILIWFFYLYNKKSITFWIIFSNLFIFIIYY